MDVQTVLKETSSWPMARQIELVRGAWNQLAEQGGEVGFVSEHADELNRRLDELDSKEVATLTLDRLRWPH